MKTALALAFILLFSSAANAEYKKIDMTVFGMDCAPCAHAVHVSMKGIQGVNTVDVNLNTGLVVVTLTPGNTAGMRQFQDAIKRNGFTYKGANIVARGTLTGPVNAPVFEVSGTKDHYTITAAAQTTNLAALIGKTVEVEGSLPQGKKGSVPDTLRYKTVTEAP